MSVCRCLCVRFCQFLVQVAAAGDDGGHGGVTDAADEVVFVVPPPASHHVAVPVPPPSRTRGPASVKYPYHYGSQQVRMDLVESSDTIRILNVRGGADVPCKVSCAVYAR